MNTTPGYAAESLLKAYEEMLAKTAITDDEATRKKVRGEFEYIPLPLDHFIQQMDVVRDLRPAFMESKTGSHFLDVGCGIGSKVWLARQFFTRASGVEITPSYCNVARKLLGYSGQGRWPNGDTPPASDNRGEIHCADALSFNYRPYNVIYFYCPLINHELQEALEFQIVKTAPVGAYIITNLKKSTKVWQVSNLRRVWRDNIYEKVKA